MKKRTMVLLFIVLAVIGVAFYINDRTKYTLYEEAIEEVIPDLNHYIETVTAIEIEHRPRGDETDFFKRTIEITDKSEIEEFLLKILVEPSDLQLKKDNYRPSGLYIIIIDSTDRRYITIMFDETSIAIDVGNIVNYYQIIGDNKIKHAIENTSLDWDYLPYIRSQ